LVCGKRWHHLLFQRNYRIEKVTAHSSLLSRAAFSVL
jgi:hypothetical protein